jgi:hypothetical protein
MMTAKQIPTEGNPRTAHAITGLAGEYFVAAE